MDRRGGFIVDHRSVIAQAAGYALKTANGYWDDALRISLAEGKVLALISGGMDSHQAAERLEIPAYLIRRHLESILEKLALRDCFRE